MMGMVSYYDLSAREPEKSYHMFTLGLLALLSSSYIIDSNRESGRGRYDIMLIPRDKSLRGIVIEFKKREAKEPMKNCLARADPNQREKIRGCHETGRALKR